MTMAMRVAGALALAVAAAGAAQAHAACATRAQAETLVIAMLPTIVEAAGRRCAAVGSPITGTAAALSRYEGDAAAAWLRVRDQVPSFLAEAKALTTLGEPEARAFLLASVSDQLKDIKAPACPLIDRGLAAMAPLPAANIATLVGLAFADAKIARDLKLCPEAPR